MAQNGNEVNPIAGILKWIDCHPRTGWYIAVLLTVNVVISLLDLLNGG